MKSLMEEFRRKREWSLKQMAEVVGVSEASICRLENGKQAMTIAMAKRLEKATGIPAARWAFPEKGERI